MCTGNGELKCVGEPTKRVLAVCSCDDVLQGVHMMMLAHEVPGSLSEQLMSNAFCSYHVLISKSVCENRFTFMVGPLREDDHL